MAISRKEEERALDKAEQELVASTRHPALQELSDKDLSHYIKLLRERRDKAQADVQRRRREMRGKATPRGAAAATSAAGTGTKQEVLSQAVRRLNAERSRRERMAVQVSQAELARKALQLKQAAADSSATPLNTRHAHQGMRKAASERPKNLIRPMELGRQRKAGAVAQAKRDS